MTNDVELVVLAGEDGNPVGTAEKSIIHTADTPLHFAFSCFLLNSEGQLLMTRRALSKKTWPGVWTNSFCGHPGPGESDEEAIQRRSIEELGLPEGAVIDVVEVLPEFQYRAVDSSGIVEWEICPVFVAQLADGAELDINPEEIDSLAWANPADIISAVEGTGFAFSPWLGEELADERLRSALLS